MSTNLEGPYQRGYHAGYEQQAAANPGTAGPMSSPEITDAIAGFTPEEESDFWLGYAHGRYHARTGQPAPGARITPN